MKNIFLLVLIVQLAILPSCEEKIQERTTTCTQKGDYDYLNNYGLGPLCTTDSCKEYQAIWKEFFMEKNHLSERYFQDHIILANSNIHTWNDGVTFSICYKVKIDWAIAYNCDQFIIKISKNNSLYPALNLPRDQYLSKENIRIAIDYNAFSSEVIHLSANENLKYNSMNHALDELIRASKINTLCSNMVFINESTGNITLEANAQYNNEENSCIIGRIDLIDGNTKIVDTPCYIN